MSTIIYELLDKIGLLFSHYMAEQTAMLCPVCTIGCPIFKCVLCEAHTYMYNDIIDSIPGCILGALACGIVLERFTSELVNGIACVILTVGMMTAPFTHTLLQFILVVGLMGLGTGFVDCSKYISSMSEFCN